VPELKKIALIEDLSNNEFVEQYAFTREDGRTGSIELKPADAERWSVFRDQLKNKNAHSSLLTKSKIEAAPKLKPKRRLAYAEMTGWRPGRKGFVLPGQVIGLNPKGICGLPQKKQIISFSDVRPAGTSQQWLKLVGPILKQSSGMMLSLSCAFAAPLLRIANEQSFGVCLAGKTGGGKTTAALIASSAFSVGSIDRLLNWNATKAGLEPALCSHNDCLLILDDLNKMPAASDKKKYLQTRDFAYNLSTGSAKLRSPAFDETGNNGAQYRIISLTTAETTIAELAARCGESRSGEARRLIEVPVYFDGLDHIFDRVVKPKPLSKIELQRLFSSAQEACAKNHGQVFADYLRFVIKTRADIENRMNRYRDQFRLQLTGSLSIVDTDIIRKFGLIYAGGALAVEGIGLPLKKTELLEAVVKCCRASLNTLSSEKRVFDDGWRTLKSRLFHLPRLHTLTQQDWNSTDGYVERHTNRARCVVKTDKFKRFFSNPLQRKLVVEELRRRQWITLSRSQEIQEQFMWPDGVRRRSLEIKWEIVRKPTKPKSN
jgi:hypothetical protein